MAGTEEAALTLGNLSVLNKVDRLRELIGNKIALPQLVVVGDQSSGKSSVLEGLTGFGFPRDAELCTRYATQITCIRDKEARVKVDIMPNPHASSAEQERVRKFHREMETLTAEDLASVFRDANDAMGIRTKTRQVWDNGTPLPAFSEHVLRVEKSGPHEEHFTVIDVPGIFRKETEGKTERSDIKLVENMVKRYIKDSRTIILAILPCNIDQATQEILTLARKADPQMERTMAVLTKPDLAIERAYQQIAIDHVTGKRNDLKLGYYIVKNRGSDRNEMTLEQTRSAEQEFFSTPPWTELAFSDKAGMGKLRERVRNLLTELVKREFKNLKSDVSNHLSRAKAEKDAMGPSRSDSAARRLYLTKMSNTFQDIARDAINAQYSSKEIFLDQNLRLITRTVIANEEFSRQIEHGGHTRDFLSDDDNSRVGKNDSRNAEESENSNDGEVPTPPSPHPSARSTPLFDQELKGRYPDLDDILRVEDNFEQFQALPGDIMGYITSISDSNRGENLGTFSASIIETMFKEQSTKWEALTLNHVSNLILKVHHFISMVLGEVCPDPQVRQDLWEKLLFDRLKYSYEQALNHAEFLLHIEREGNPFTYNHYFNDDLQKSQSKRHFSKLRKLGMTLRSSRDITSTDDRAIGPGDGFFIRYSDLEGVSRDQSNRENQVEFIHDVLKSYYKVSRKRFVDVVCQQVINHFLIRGDDCPLKVLTIDMILGLSDEQLEAIASESTLVRAKRENLAREIASFQKAFNVLNSSGDKRF